MSSVLMTYPNQEYLNPPFVANAIEHYMTGELLAESEAEIVNVGNKSSVSWIEEKYSDKGDPRRVAALDNIELRDGSLFPHVQFSMLEVKSAALKTWGIEMDFSREVVRNPDMVNFVRRGIQRGAYWLAYLLNELVFNSMTNNWSTTPSTETNDEPWNLAAPNGIWNPSNTSRNPIDDVRQLSLLVEDTDNFTFELDRGYFRKDNYSELLNYLQQPTNVYGWAKDPTTGGWNQLINGEIKANGVHKSAGIPNSTALFLSRNTKPTTIYERVDPLFARQRLQDNSGNTLPGAYHVHRYFTDKDHVTHVQIWREMYPVTTRWGRKSVGILRTL